MGMFYIDDEGDLKHGRLFVAIVHDGGKAVEFGDRMLCLDRDEVPELIARLQRWYDTGSFELDRPAEEAATKFLNGLGDEIKGVAETVERLTERVAALEGVAKKPLPYGLWNLEGGNWHSSSPFESAGDASRYAHKNFYADWRNSWRVYPYPEDGGMPMELRETPVTVWVGGTNYVYDQPKLPTLWGVWLEPDNRWAGSHIGEGSIAFFRSKVASEKYASDCGGEARPLPIEELINDA